ncbi:glycosyltransferase family 4 protein [Vogesella indigofera]|uniref:glycosyltransferase family 4 protein n=1 Tax=Vogesella indigofera TaxID=45465 RepID=UPI003F41F6F1
MLTKYGRMGASSRMRSLQYMPWYLNEGVSVKIAPFISDDMLAARYASDRHALFLSLKAYWARLLIMLQAARYDLVWIEKEALPWLPVWLEKWLLRNVPYVLDYDDAIFHNYDLHRLPIIRRIYGRRLDSLMAGAGMVIAGNDYLASRAWRAGASRVEVVPTVVDIDRYKPKPLVACSLAVVSLVWIGSPSTAKYLNLLTTGLQRLSQSFSLRLIVVGAEVSMPGVEVLNVKWSEASEAHALLEGDIGIMPLSETPWELGKCGYKLIQYMACGLPVVASAVGANNQIVQNGINGFLASSPEEWDAALEKLILNSQLRWQLGQAGRAIVEKKYCIQATAPVLIRHIQGCAEDFINLNKREVA